MKEGYHNGLALHISDATEAGKRRLNRGPLPGKKRRDPHPLALAVIGAGLYAVGYMAAVQFIFESGGLW